MIRKAAHVHDDLVRAGTNTVGASPYLVGAIGKNADALREERADVNRWSALEDELLTMYKGVAAANLARRHLGLTVLQTYAITRQLVRQKVHADLLPHFEEMRRAIKFKRKRTAPADDPPVVVPAPVPTKP